VAEPGVIVVASKAGGALPNGVTKPSTASSVPAAVPLSSMVPVLTG
jgi:hypothetical protein